MREIQLVIVGQRAESDLAQYHWRRLHGVGNQELVELGGGRMVR